jgi:A/G-specific adenine glycosylase
MIRPEISDFLQSLRQFYEEEGRHGMLWRQPGPDGGFDPYAILVSELMLQQTQVSRVTPKYSAFIARFPDVRALAAGSLGEVLSLWQGLGYNRRARYLHLAAISVMRDFGDTFPATIEDLQKLPGVGPNTAGAIMAYAYGKPVVYLETNIRTVLIHHFFKDEEAIPDKRLREILAIVVDSLEKDFGPREFYWAMMDYGAFLKKSVGNLNRASKSYTRQTAFHGSRRQLRGLVIRLLTERSYTYEELVGVLDDDRAESVVDDLVADQLVRRRGSSISLE